jgi:poly-beta-1,6-N-acetyl-D-glucosamine synthase
MTLGPWDPSTQVEDMKLTWRLQEMNRRTLVSRKARCYVDAMRTYHTLMTQRLKWDGGLVGLLTDKNGQAKSRHTGFLWRQQAKMALDAFTRVLFFCLVAVALTTNQYRWNWLWLIPPVVASTLNIRLALRVPQHRPIDVFLAGTLVSPELYLWVRLLVWAKVWTRKLSVQERDGWESQYAAQRGDTKSHLAPALACVAAVGGAAAWLCIRFRAQLTDPTIQHATKFDLRVGFVALTALAIAQTLAMLRQHWLLRSNARG